MLFNNSPHLADTIKRFTGEMTTRSVVDSEGRIGDHWKNR